MEAAEALGRGACPHRGDGPRVGRARSRAFWIVAGLTAARRRPALRDARRPVLPPRRDRHRRPRPARQLRRRDERGRLQRVGAAALLRAGLGLDPADRDRRVRPALALGAGRGGDRPGRLPARRGAARPPRRDRRRGARRGQPDAALVLAGGARLRAAGPADALSALYFVRALDARPPRGPHRLGHRLGAGPRDPLLRHLPDRRGGALAAAPPRPGALAGLWIVALAGAAAGPARDPPDVDRPRGMDRRPRPRPPALGVGATFLVGETGDIIARPETRCRRSPPFLLVLVALFVLLGARGDRRGAPRRGHATGARRGYRRASRWRWRSSRPTRTTSSPATCCRRWCRCWSRSRSASTLRGARRAGRLVGGGPVRLLARLLRPGERLAGAAAPRLEGGRREARRAGSAAGDRHLDPRPGPAAPLPGRATPFQVVLRRTLRLVRARGRLRLRRAGAAGAARACSARASGRSAYGPRRPPLPAALRAAGARPGAAAAARPFATPISASAATGSWWTGSGRAKIRASGERGEERFDGEFQGPTCPSAGADRSAGTGLGGTGLGP